MKDHALVYEGEDLLKVVEDLNDRLPEGLTENGYTVFSIYHNGYVTGISFGEIPLWDCENDDRPWSDEGDEYTMSIEEYVVKEMKKILSLLNSVDW